MLRRLKRKSNCCYRWRKWLRKSDDQVLHGIGRKVAITSRDLDKLKNTASELESETGGTCLPLQCDVRHYDEVENMLQAVLKSLEK
jgi:short-subunit dehydrogenase